MFCDETPELFRDHAQTVLKNAKSKFVFIKSWNEWAEGNYLEPDLKFGKQYIAALSEAVSSQQSAVSSQQSAVYYLVNFYLVKSLEPESRNIRRCA